MYRLPSLFPLILRASLSLSSLLSNFIPTLYELIVKNTLQATMSAKFRLPSLLQVSSLLSHQPHQISPFLLPFLHTQYRASSVLSALSDNRGAYNKKIRRGRGPSSGKGKTSGRGHKGQKAHGKVPRGFNGGQTPDHIVNPIRGTDNRNTKFVSLFTLKAKCHFYPVRL